MNQSKQLTDGALLTAIYIVLLLVSFYIPFIALIAMFLLPIPFVVFAYRYDWKPALIMFVAAIILSSLFATLFSIPITVLTSLGGIMIGTALHRKASAYEIWARGTVGFVAGFLFAFLFGQLIFQIDFAKEFDQLLNESMDTSIALMEQFGLANQATEELEAIQQQIATMLNLLPVFLVMLSLFIAFISQWLSFKVINRIDQKQFSFPPFRNLQFPTTIVWIYFFALIITFFQQDPNSTVFIGGQNILMLAGLLMIIQGFSFIFYFSHSKKQTKAIPVIVVILSLILSQILLPLIRILGIIDIGFRLRDRITKEKK